MLKMVKAVLNSEHDLPKELVLKLSTSRLIMGQGWVRCRCLREQVIWYATRQTLPCLQNSLIQAEWYEWRPRWCRPDLASTSTVSPPRRGQTQSITSKQIS